MFLVTLLWSFNFITSKVAMRQWNPVLLTGWRTTLALLICLPLYWRERPHAWTWPIFWRFVGLGTLGMAANQLFFAMGVKRTSVAHGALIVGLTPLFVYLLSCAVGHEHFRPRKLLGMGLALAGISVLQAKSSAGASLLGDALVLLGCLTFTIFTVFSKPLSGALSPIGTVTLNFLGAVVFLAPATITLSIGFPFRQLLPISWLCLLFMAAVPSVFCFLLYYRVLQRLPASKLTSFTYLQPIMASTMAIPLLGEAMSISLLAGGLMILAGVYLAERF
ncbi:MAG: DMT family transporter [Acidobacteriota bacterium]|jgi:drug/metabolite transporter (DMT)-like permease